jgi:malate dehydrogenase
LIDIPGQVKRIAVTGAAGQIAYSLLFRLIQEPLYGKVPIALHLLDIPEQMKTLEGVAMELEDVASESLKEIHLGSNSLEVFKDVDFAFLVGAKPRGPGMERSDLLFQNAQIFASQSKALQSVGSSDLRLLVVGNPCNTNAWVCSHFAPEIAKNRIHAMTRLDQNRARSLLAKKARVELSQVSSPIIWGNHSSTLVADFIHTSIRGLPVSEKLDRSWLESVFMDEVQQRGAKIIQARGKSSAASAASAAWEAAWDLLHPTLDGKFFSSATYSKGNTYGIDEDLFFSFPCRVNKDLESEIVSGFGSDHFTLNKIKLTEQELISERQQVLAFLESK